MSDLEKLQAIILPSQLQPRLSGRKRHMPRSPFSAKELAIARVTVQAVIDKVCPAFGVDPPGTVRVFRTFLSKYRWADGRLNIGWDSKSYIESVVLHELTHHILNQNMGPHLHGIVFWEVLWQVIEFYFGNRINYAWQHEYHHGKKYARNRGIQIK